MKLIYIVIIIIWLLILLTIKISIEPYVLIPQAGFSNRIRVLLAYKNLYKNINVNWIKDKSCNGHFSEIFEPIYGIKFTNNKIPLLYKGFDTYETIIKANNKEYSENEEKNEYKKLKLLPNIQEKVDKFVKENNINESIALHIRRTDHISLAKEKNSYTSDNDFIEYINKLTNNLKIFIATDNRQTQDKFMKLYPDRVVFYKLIDSYSNSNRNTSLEDSVIDIYIASRAKYFKGSSYSSFSNFIELLR